jgi:hypothetical protein
MDPTAVKPQGWLHASNPIVNPPPLDFPAHLKTFCRAKLPSGLPADCIASGVSGSES